MADNQADKERYTVIGQRLLQLLRPGFGGSPAPEFIAELRALANEAKRIAQCSYVDEKAFGLVHWAEIACSRSKFKQWGLDRVEMFAYQDAYKVADGPMRWLIEEKPKD